MTVHSKLEICNQEGEIIRCYKTKRFTGTTITEDIEAFILKKYKNSIPPFDIKILDQQHGYVTLDNDYLEEYTPFNIEKTNTTTVQPTNSSETTVTLRITLPHHILYSIVDQQYMKAVEEVLETVAGQNEQIQRIDDVLSTSEPLKYPIIRLSKDPKMGFIPGHNVNEKQRDQYICDQVNVDTGATTGTLSMLQGEKDSSNKYKSILPRFKIWNDDIKNRADHVWTLLVFIVLDVYQLGKHSLVSHSQRTFVQNGNVTQQLNPYEIPITTVDWMSNMGMELKLTTVVIEGAKKHSNMSLNTICDLKDINESESFDLSCNYSKSRLALVLREDNTIQWETLVLSNEMNFKKKIITSSITNILNVPADTSSTSSKRRRSKNCETTSNQRSKRTKTQKVEDQPLMVNLSTNNNDSSLLLNQNLTIRYNNNEFIPITSQTMSNIPIVNSELILDSTGIDNPFGDSIDIINILSNDFNFSAAMNTDNIVLINDDSSFNVIDSFNFNSPNS